MGQKVIRHRIIKKIILVDGKPVETETIESPIESNLGNESQSNEEEENPENIKYVEKTIRKRIIKRIVMEDGKPIETEQIIEDPEVTDDNIEIDIGQQDSFQRVTRKKIIKKIIIVNGKPVEIEEVMDEPSETIKEDIAENFSTKVVNVDQAQDHTAQKVIRKKIIKKIIVIDGKPVETEEVVEDPVDMSASEQFDTVNVDPTQNYSVQKVIRKRIVRKIVIVDGKPVETEEIIEDPVE